MDHRKRAEESPRGGEDELRDLIEKVPAMVFMASPGPSNTYASRGWREYSGLGAEDTEGLGWQRAVHPEDLQRHMEKWRLHSASREPFEDETRFRRAADGAYRWFLVRAVPRCDQDGNVLRWYGTLVDIDDRKRAEEALRRSEAYLAESQRLTHTGSFATDAKTFHTHYCSEEDLRIWGLEQHGPPDLEIAAQRMHPDDRAMVLEQAKRACDQGTDEVIDFRIVLPDGTLKHVHSICHPVFSASGEVFDSNILLTPFDREMRLRGYQLTRFADDWVVTCKSAAEARAALDAARRILKQLGVRNGSRACGPRKNTKN